MKYIIPAIALLLLTAQTRAQFLKKLKEKTEKAVEKKISGNDSPSATGNSGTGEGEAAKSDGSASAASGSRPGGDARMVFTLAPDEKLLYDESRVYGYNNQLNYSFVVQNRSYDFFLIENGIRTGPFKTAPLKSAAPAENFGIEDRSDEISLGNEQKDPVALQYSKTINGKLFIVFNGKNYGPYDHISKMLVSPDKKKFFAVVINGGQSPMMAQMGMGHVYMVNEGSLNMRAGTSDLLMPMRFSVSEGFAHCMVTVLDQQTQQVLTMSSAGKKEEGTMADLYSGNTDQSLVNDRGDIISIPSKSPTQVLVNGTEAARFKVPVKNRNRLYLGAEPARSVYYEKGMLYRGDGTTESLKGVLFPSFATVNNETSVYYFQIYQDEKGAKEVYLCRKAL